MPTKSADKSKTPRIIINRGRHEENLETVRKYIQDLGKKTGLVLRTDFGEEFNRIRSYLYQLEEAGEIRIYSRGDERRHIQAIIASDQIDSPVKAYTFVDFPGFDLPDDTSVHRYNFFALHGLFHAYDVEKTITPVKPTIFLTPKPAGIHNSEWVVFQRMRAAGFSTVFSSSPNEEIDELMSGSILELKDSENDILLNVVSGSYDFYPAVKAVIDNLRHRGFKAEVRIFSWSKHLDRGWKDWKNVYYLDDLVRFFDYIARNSFKRINLPEIFLQRSEMDHVTIGTGKTQVFPFARQARS